jgi:hypothetical protein
VFRLGVFALLLLPTPLFADPITINFESHGDLDSVTTQHPGLTFTNAVALTAGVSLNEFDFPPHSGSNVVFDAGGVMRIDFNEPVSNVGGYFTYAAPLLLQASDAAGNLLGSISSLFVSNTVGSGGSSNEFIALAFSNIASVTFSGDVLGGSFVLDDLTYTPGGAAPPVPEPGTLILMLTGGLGLMRLRRSRRNETAARN